MAAKTGKKTAISPRSGAEIPTGAHPKNTGGKKGRSGRKPQAFKTFASALAMDPEFQKQLEAAALAGDLQAMKLVIQYAEGMPPQSVEHTGKLEHEHTGTLVWGGVEIPL